MRLMPVMQNKKSSSLPAVNLKKNRRNLKSGFYKVNLASLSKRGGKKGRKGGKREEKGEKRRKKGGDVK